MCVCVRFFFVVATFTLGLLLQADIADTQDLIVIYGFAESLPASSCQSFILFSPHVSHSLTCVFFF